MGVFLYGSSFPRARAACVFQFVVVCASGRRRPAKPLRALKASGEEIKPAKGKNNQYVKAEGSHPFHSRTIAAREAGLSEHQQRAQCLQVWWLRLYLCGTSLFEPV